MMTTAYEALRTAIESSHNQVSSYVCLWRRDDGAFDYNHGDSRWACAVLANNPHFIWKVLEPEEIVDEDEAATLVGTHDLVSVGYITHEHVHALLGTAEAVEREAQAATTSPLWDDFIAAAD